MWCVRVSVRFGLVSGTGNGHSCWVLVGLDGFDLRREDVLYRLRTKDKQKTRVTEEKTTYNRLVTSVQLCPSSQSPLAQQMVPEVNIKVAEFEV